VRVTSIAELNESVIRSSIVLPELKGVGHLNVNGVTGGLSPGNFVLGGFSQGNFVNGVANRRGRGGRGGGVRLDYIILLFISSCPMDIKLDI
jgi:hypothetical protein